MIDTYENERSVLGCLIQYPHLHAYRIPQLSEEFFSDKEHKAIYNALHSAYKKHNTHFDSTLVLTELIQADKFTDTLKTELYACCSNVIESTPFDEHMKILYDTAQQRFIKAELERMHFEGGCTVQALKELTDVSERAYGVGIDRDYRSDYCRYIENLGKIKPTLKTGFSKVDRVTGGLQKGTLCIIGARPSVGKTTFSLNIALNVAKSNKKVLFFSLEMTTKMVLDRLCSRLCDINYNDFKKPLQESDIAKIEQYLSSGNFKENLQVIDDVNTVENICNYIVKSSPDFVVIDYAQIVKTVKTCDNIRVQIDYISSELKQIAKRTKCCVVLISQLSRKTTGTERPPAMSDLKESSSLEQDGDYIFLLHRPYTENKVDYIPTDTKLIVEKNKFGSTGVIDLYFDGAFQKFTEITDKH